MAKNLKDQLKKTKPRGKAPSPPAPVEVKIDNETAAEMVKTMRDTTMVLLQELHKATLMNSALLQKLSDQLTIDSAVIAELVAKEPVAPTVVLPDRPTSFEVDIREDGDGKPIGLSIAAKNSLH
jgi:hypothetical protein